MQKIQTPDFNYPQNVMANAEKALQEGLAKHDQNMVVTALVQHSLASTSISRESLDGVMQKIDSVLQVGKLTPDYAALLWLLKSEIWEGCYLHPFHTVQEVSEQRNACFNTAIEILGQSGKEYQMKPIQQYKGIIVGGNELGNRCVPTLYDFMAERCPDNEALQDSLKAIRIDLHKDDSDFMPMMYLEGYTNKNYDQDKLAKAIATYRKYAEHEESALLLALGGSRDSLYAEQVQYLTRHPKSGYGDMIRNLKARTEDKDVSMRHPKLLQSTDSIRVTTNVRNVNQYELSLYRIPDKIRNSTAAYTKVSDLQLVESLQMEAEGTVPFDKKDIIVTFKPQPLGHYIVLASYPTPQGVRKLKQITRYQRTNESIGISNLRAFLLEEKLFVVESQNGAPVKGATVTLQDWNGKNKIELITNNEGYINIPEKETSFRYSIRYGNDNFCPTESGSNYKSFTSKDQLQIQIHTDLNIYRPGETVQVSMIAYGKGVTLLKAAPKQKLKVEFEDASGNKIGEPLWVTTDSFGQATCQLAIPTDRMNGQFSIQVSGEWGSDTARNTHWINVSEYKTPTFYVDLSETPTSQEKDGQALIKGRVMTYAGVPVANSKVECRLEQQTWWRFWSFDENTQEHTFTVETDAEGRFEYHCPAEWTQTKGFYTYLLSAICTNMAGESHDAQTSFWIGSNRGIVPQEATYKLDGNQHVALKYNYNSTQQDETSVIARYQLIREGKTILESTFDIIRQDKADWSKVPSGTYQLKMKIEDQEDEKYAEAKVIIYRESDQQAPTESALWIPKASQSVTDKGKARFLIGTSCESNIYYVATSRDQKESEGWIHFKAGMHWMELPIPSTKDEVLNVKFATIHDGEHKTEELHFDAPLQNEVKLTAVSFRDKITPGSREHWTFSLTDQKGKPAKARMLLELYNQALENLSSNRWGMNAGYVTHYFSGFSFQNFWDRTNNLSYSEVKNNIKRHIIGIPTLELYNSAFFQVGETFVVGYGGMRKSRASLAPKNAMIRGMAASAAPDDIECLNMVENDVEIEECEMMSFAASPKSKGDASKTEAGFDQIELRSEEVKVALWEPQLTTDREGNISVEWEVPNFNTTWCMQALAYDENMASNLLVKTVLAQRPLMVQPSLPRYLRAGDKTELAANVMNASDETQEAKVLIELFDPRTDKVISNKQLTLTIEAQGTQAVTIGYTAPAGAAFVGFRIKALDKSGNGDGEQQMLPILTDISPVIETTPFYLNPSEQTRTIAVNQPKKGSKDNRLTLEYCNNPTWYCITALPTIANESAVTSIGIAHSLYALAAAGRYAQQNPQVLDVINQWKQQADSASNPLISRLRQNADQKISTLLASPWLPEAERQELRMEALDRLFAQSQSAASLDKLIDRLKAFRRNDGGFSWIDDSNYHGYRDESSYWATSQVLQLIGKISHLGCMTENADLRQMTQEALHFLDKKTLEREDELLKDFRKSKYGASKADKSRPSYTIFSDYVYIRTLFEVSDFKIADSGRYSRIVKRTLDDLEEEWSGLQIADKAYAAIVLHRNERTDKARSIIESLRQFAIKHPQRGMYWENIAQRSWFKPVACTSVVLQAFAEVEPRQAELDVIRKWMLLEKQTSDWGGSSLAADAVYALLTTGTDWLKTEPAEAVIHLGKNQEDIVLPADHLGYISVALPADVKEIQIERKGNNPAWGAIYHQYAAPMKQINAQHVDEVRIEKKITIEGNVAHVELSVRCTKAMEYVVIQDERPASLEPVDQTSSYHWQRGFYYQETKDHETRFFINRLEAGVHTFSYDCYVTNPGTFSNGIATIQSMYAPQFTAHSAGSTIVTQLAK